ncbi:MAG: type II toxin-antitoxin system Phd/YefM family antitoxin [Fervidobacterium sp.]
MRILKKTLKFYSLADAKAKFSKVVDDSRSFDIVVTKNGEPACVVINYEKYAKLMDFIERVWELYLLDVGDPSLFNELKMDDLFENIPESTSQEEG